MSLGGALRGSTSSAAVAPRRSTLVSRAPLLVALLASVVLLVCGNALPAGVWRSAVAVVAGLAVALAAGCTVDDLGLRPRHLVRGIAVGAFAGVALGLPGALLVLAAPIAGVEHVRLAEMEGLSDAALLRSLAVGFPLNTALVEELVFRGALYAFWLRAIGAAGAVLASSVVFAGWHVVIAARTVSDSEVADGAVWFALAYIGALLAVLIGGVVFALLRWRTSSVAAPVMAHWLSVVLIRVAIRAQ